jgi:hypothetical protein
MTNKEKIIEGQAERERIREEEFARKRREYEESMRFTGRTTRLIDNYVQELFRKREVILKDHYKDGEDYLANSYLANRFKDRINLEHRDVEVKYYNSGNALTAKIVKGQSKIFFK